MIEPDLTDGRQPLAMLLDPRNELEGFVEIEVGWVEAGGGANHLAVAIGELQVTLGVGEGLAYGDDGFEPGGASALEHTVAIVVEYRVDDMCVSVE